MPPGHPGRENLWAEAFRVIVDEKTGFLTPLGAVFGIKKRHRLYKTYGVK